MTYQIWVVEVVILFCWQLSLRSTDILLDLPFCLFETFNNGLLATDLEEKACLCPFWEFLTSTFVNTLSVSQ
jgi:hypothetical protein